MFAFTSAQIGTEDDGFEKKDSVKLKTPTVDVIENFLLVLGHLYLKDQRYRDDFRVALVKSQSRFIFFLFPFYLLSSSQTFLASHFRNNSSLDWGLVTKWAQLLITQPTITYPAH